MSRKGIPNKGHKAALHARLEEKFGSDWDPVVKMAELANVLVEQAVASQARPEIESAVTALEKVAKYVRPQLKAVEMDLKNTDGSLRPVQAIRLVPMSSDQITQQIADNALQEPSGLLINQGDDDE